MEQLELEWQREAIAKIVREFAGAGDEEQREAETQAREMFGPGAAEEVRAGFERAREQTGIIIRQVGSGKVYRRELSPQVVVPVARAPEPEAEVELNAGEREAPAALEAVAVEKEPPAEGGEPQSEKANVAPPVLSANAPFDTARVFAERCCREDGATVVWFWQGQFWRWNGRFYSPEPDEVMRGQVYAFLDGASRWVGNQTVRFQPTPRHVNEVLDCLKTGLARGVEYQPPMWFGTQKPATEWIVFQNGIVNVLTGEVRELTPDLWAHSALAFDWDSDAKCPTWDQFSEDVFPDDEESKEFLEEWMGYCMTEETRFQKGAMLIGPKRSGKGTISHVLRQMVGDGSYVGLSFNTWASGENSKECLIGKRVGVFADVRFKPGRAYGASFDPGGIGHVSTELLLNIIGEDTVSIGRKYKSPWHGQLRLKLMLISNEVPNLNDPGGVLPSRFVKVRFGVSFFGREDVTLRDKLSVELSGIAARCVKAYQRLCERGRFVQPQSADALERDVLAASDPFTAMALECFEPDPAGEVVKIAAYGRFERWCRDTGRIDMLRTTPANRFGGRLRAVAGFEQLGDYRPGGNKSRVWTGITVKST